MRLCRVTGFCLTLSAVSLAECGGEKLGVTMSESRLSSLYLTGTG